ncbi:MAG: GNAT family N-acetyltransferase [Candidatus Schekmanbacteria bacterium]|nr:GNAT family N-acetyltransferase [Candidatus Schekmanbacteria bacterium]
MLEISICNSLERLIQLEREWNSLETEQKGFNVFMSFPWIAGWFRHIGNDAVPLIITARCDGKLAGLIPLAVKTGMVIPAGYPESDFIDVLCEDEVREEFLSEIFKFLFANFSTSKLVYIKSVPEESGLYKCFSRFPAPSGFGSSLTYLSSCNTSDISSGWEDYFKSFSTKVCADFRRRWKIASGYGEVGFHVIAGDEITEEVINDAVSINLAGRKALKKTAFFQDNRRIEFFKDLVKSSVIKKQMLVAFLKIGDKPAAYKICFINGDEVWEYNTAFREEYASCSPGKLLTLRLLEYLAQKGFKSYNFLKGDEPYKKDFAVPGRRLFIISLYRKNLISMLSYFYMVRGREILRRSKFITDIYDRFFS